MEDSSGHANYDYYYYYFHGQKSLESVPGAEIPLGQVMHKPTLKALEAKESWIQGGEKRKTALIFHSLLKVSVPWNSPFLPFPSQQKYSHLTSSCLNSGIILPFPQLEGFNPPGILSFPGCEHPRSATPGASRKSRSMHKNPLIPADPQKSQGCAVCQGF